MTDAAHRARSRFPRGLFQPPGSFRFSADALLLAAFAARHWGTGGGSLLDLGCGCGVVGLACLLALPGLTAVGLDIQPELTAAARENALRLGLEGRFRAVAADLAAPEAVRSAGSGHAMVTANMPYRPAGSGRLPASKARRTALFADGNTVPAFLRAAGETLDADGSFVLIYPWAERDFLLGALAAHGFAPREILPVRTGTEDGARCLVRAERAKGMAEAGSIQPKPRLLPPLSLRSGKGGPYTAAALEFCPWLDTRHADAYR